MVHAHFFRKINKVLLKSREPEFCEPKIKNKINSNLKLNETKLFLRDYYYNAAIFKRIMSTT
jgi:hypothetical protein